MKMTKRPKTETAHKNVKNDPMWQVQNAPTKPFQTTNMAYMKLKRGPKRPTCKQQLSTGWTCWRHYSRTGMAMVVASVNMTACFKNTKSIKSKQPFLKNTWQTAIVHCKNTRYKNNTVSNSDKAWGGDWHKLLLLQCIMRPSTATQTETCPTDIVRALKRYDSHTVRQNLLKHS